MILIFVFAMNLYFSENLCLLQSTSSYTELGGANTGFFCHLRSESTQTETLTLVLRTIASYPSLEVDKNLGSNYTLRKFLIGLSAIK